jgi:guanylate kinase
MRMTAKSGRPLAIIGPSGCGKSSALKLLLDRELVAITPTWTDRPPRPGEDELEHRFVNAVELADLECQDAFKEVVQPFGLPFRYGMPHLEEADRPVVIMIRAPFVQKFREYYPLGAVYQIEASYEFAEAAIKARTGEPEGTRLSHFEAEVAAGRVLANRIFRNEGGSLPGLAEQIWKAMQADDLAPDHMHFELVS